MDIETYKLSRTFLFRHHTLRTMRDILRNYKSGVPTHKRTPQWFLEQYFHGFAYPPHRRWSRINSIEDAESCDEGTNDLDQMSGSRPANAETHRPRHLRIVHKNEVWSIFVSHSEWIFSLVQNHKDLKGEVHGYGWESFLAKVPRLRKSAVSDEETNGKWGLRDEQEEGSRACKTRLVVEVPAPTPKPKSRPQSTVAAPKKRKRRTKSPPARVRGFLCTVSQCSYLFLFFSLHLKDTIPSSDPLQKGMMIAALTSILTTFMTLISRKSLHLPTVLHPILPFSVPFLSMTFFTIFPLK